MQYRSEIDGLRAVAVIPVILFHGGLQVFSGGFVGVDVFFVISGYLITTIIIDDINADRFTIASFYSRRFRRILPALFFVVLVTIPFAWFLMLPSQFKDFAQSITAVSIFSSNGLFWIESGYFEAAAEKKPLLHTWSLAVEEQYYITFPVFMLLLWKSHTRPAVIALAVAFVFSLGLTEYAWRHFPDANFYLLPTRAWELLAGSGCAIFLSRYGLQSNNTLSLSGLGLVLVGIFAFDGSTPFPSLYTLAPVVGAALIILYAGEGTLVARVLSVRGIVLVGLISYSAYLWHQPIFAFARVYGGIHPPIEIMMGLAFLSVFLAYFSWRFVERPFRVSRQPPRVVIPVSLSISAVFAALGIVLAYTDFQKSSFFALQSPSNQRLLSEISRVSAMDPYAEPFADVCRFTVDGPFSAFQDRYDTCEREHGKPIVVFGDSHSADVFNALSATLDRPFIVGVGQGDCRPHIEGHTCSGSDLTRFFESEGRDLELALYVQAGLWLFLDETGAPGARSPFLQSKDPKVSLHTAGIDRVFHFLSQMSRITPNLVWLGPRIEPYITQEEMLSYQCDDLEDRPELSIVHRAAFENLDRYLRREALKREIEYLSDIEVVAFDPKADLYNCDDLFWSDSDHWSDKGEQRFGMRLKPHVEKLIDK